MEHENMSTTDDSSVFNPSSKVSLATSSKPMRLNLPEQLNEECNGGNTSEDDLSALSEEHLSRMAGPNAQRYYDDEEGSYSDSDCDGNYEKSDDLQQKAQAYAPIRKPYRSERYIPWDRIAATKRWGETSLLRYLPIPEMDQLIGWATHIETSDAKDESAKDFNPLACLSCGTTNNVPLRPGYLRYVHDTAVDRIRGFTRRDNSTGIRTKRKTEFSDGISAAATETGLNKENCLFEKFDITALIAIGMLIEETITATLLPFAQEHVNRCRELDHNEAKVEKNKRQKLIIDHYLNDPNHHSFFQWTLPPEEAIANLVMSSSIDSYRERQNPADSLGIHGLPTAYPPTRTNIRDIKKLRRKIKKPLPNDDIDSSLLLQQACANWCQTRKYPDHLRNRRLHVIEDKKQAESDYDFDDELFSMFLPHLPEAKKPGLKDVQVHIQEPTRMNQQLTNNAIKQSKILVPQTAPLISTNTIQDTVQPVSTRISTGSQPPVSLLSVSDIQKKTKMLPSQLRKLLASQRKDEHGAQIHTLLNKVPSESSGNKSRAGFQKANKQEEESFSEV